MGMETRKKRATAEPIVARRAAIGGVILGLCLVGGGAAAMPAHQEAQKPAAITCYAQPDYMCAPIRYPLPGESEP